MIIITILINLIACAFMIYSTCAWFGKGGMVLGFSVYTGTGWLSLHGLFWLFEKLEKRELQKNQGDE